MEPAQVRDLNKLQPYLKDRAEKLIAEGKKQGLTITVIETLRTQIRQTYLHNENEANPALLGPHGFGCAFDAVPLKNGKVDWTATDLFKRMGALGKSLGLEWGGDWKKFDCPHFQYTGGLSDAQLRAGKLPKFPNISKELNTLDSKDIQIAELQKQIQALKAELNTAKANAKAAQQYLKRINPDFIG